MYEAIRGILKEKEPLKAIVEAGGIAYRLSIPLSTYKQLPPIDAPVYLFLSHIVREDAHTLYAFLLKEERDFFETLIAISGIGPKTAAGIIGHMELKMFYHAIHTSDTRTLSKLPGIGKKTAERLIIEMRDKIKGEPQDALPISSAGLGSDAISALLNLGYKHLDAQKAVDESLKEGEMDLGRLITAALQKI